MSIESLIGEVSRLNACVYWAREHDHRDPYHPEIQRAILRDGAWVVKLAALRPKVGRHDPRTATGTGHTLETALKNAIERFKSPYTYTPKPKITNITLEDLGL